MIYILQSPWLESNPLQTAWVFDMVCNITKHFIYRRDTTTCDMLQDQNYTDSYPMF